MGWFTHQTCVKLATDRTGQDGGLGTVLGQGLRLLPAVAVFFCDGALGYSSRQ